MAYVVEMAIDQCECHVGKCNSVLLIKFHGKHTFSMSKIQENIYPDSYALGR